MIDESDFWGAVAVFALIIVGQNPHQMAPGAWVALFGALGRFAWVVLTR